MSGLFPDEITNPQSTVDGPIPESKYIRNWLNEREQAKLIEQIDACPWPLTDMVRRVQHYGYRYDYKAKRVTPDMKAGPMPEHIQTRADQLWDAGLTPERFDQSIVNEYEPGQGIGHHVDCVPCFGPLIATISLGASVEMEFEKLAKEDDGTRLRRYLMLEPGALLILKGEARYGWTHGIPARTHDHRRPRTRRLSVTFRTVIV